MTIALATRGYLCTGGLIQVLVGKGPDIIGQRELVPEISGAAAAVAQGPTITGSVVPGPTISGGGSSATTGVEPPHISGSDKPKIG